MYYFHLILSTAMFSKSVIRHCFCIIEENIVFGNFYRNFINNKDTNQ